MDLASQKCIPCQGGTPPLQGDEIKKYHVVVPKWTLKEKSIERKFKFKNFVKAMDFLNKVAEIAEEEGHHPDIHLYYNKLTLELTTHAIGGLSSSDFIMAAKIDRLR